MALDQFIELEIQKLKDAVATSFTKLIETHKTLNLFFGPVYGYTQKICT